MLHRLLEEEKYAEAARQFVLGDDLAGVVSDGLLRRREAERAMFFTP
jgi:GH24 family phage-related lysozyme (muramidase)